MLPQGWTNHALASLTAQGNGPLGVGTIRSVVPAPAGALNWEQPRLRLP